ncbi:MAG: hypothetical protein C0602_05630 [Denitrovibrio sp.]|nr:MAG: hypothetical protein C0602_05630 [Denitrovibrio sp.]
MKFGKRSKRPPLKPLAFALALVCFFIYANLTAETTAHKAEVTLLPDDKLLSELVKDISEANTSVHIAMYMFKSYRNETNGAGLIKRALIKAADRGAEVYVVLDQTGEDDFVEKENKKLGKELKEHNIIVVYDKEDVRMHTKCAVIDREITYIGSHNYTNSAMKYNREMTAKIVSKGASEDAIRHIFSVK